MELNQCGWRALDSLAILPVFLPIKRCAKYDFFLAFITATMIM